MPAVVDAQQVRATPDIKKWGHHPDKPWKNGLVRKISLIGVIQPIATFDPWTNLHSLICADYRSGSGSVDGASIVVRGTLHGGSARAEVAN